MSKFYFLLAFFFYANAAYSMPRSPGDAVGFLGLSGDLKQRTSCYLTLIQLYNRSFEPSNLSQSFQADFSLLDLYRQQKHLLFRFPYIARGTMGSDWFVAASDALTDKDQKILSLHHFELSFVSDERFQFGLRHTRFINHQGSAVANPKEILFKGIVIAIYDPAALTKMQQDIKENIQSQKPLPKELIEQAQDAVTFP
ncbi:MAG: hypothetical protein J0L93_10390 [Deltaproteobacteria bacterium]|nr:hypothetical protein [Deltaproteobacteria bacterium]